MLLEVQNNFHSMPVFGEMWKWNDKSEFLGAVLQQHENHLNAIFNLWDSVE